MTKSNYSPATLCKDSLHRRRSKQHVYPTIRAFDTSAAYLLARSATGFRGIETITQTFLDKE
ncbi:MAG: hypothetical protein J2P31_03675, partial [Blastocatellia bacterium]|nr:hypothetical protein [Blastocatellia bacterium]